MNCVNCGKKIPYEDATCCPHCGNSLEPKQKSSDLVLVAGTLTIIAATFVGAMGTIGLINYIQLLAYYDPNTLLGFLIFGFLGIVACAVGIPAGVFVLQRKRFNFSLIGIGLVLASGIVSIIIILQYQYGFTDIIIFSEICAMIFSLLSLIITTKSKTKFSQTQNQLPPQEETPEPSPQEDLSDSTSK